MVIKKWNFPEMLMKTVLQHHAHSFADDEDPYQMNLSCIVALANLFCHKLGLGVRDPETELDLFGSFPAQHLKMDEERIVELYNQFEEAYNKDKGFFA